MIAEETDMNLLIRSVLAAAMLIPFDAVFKEAEAAGAGTCNQYVTATRSLAARAKAAKCDFWGGGFNEAASRRWCNGVREQTIRDAMPADAKKVENCEVCRGYSNAANAAAREAQAFRCGFSGSDWNEHNGGPNDDHFTYCLRKANDDRLSRQVQPLYETMMREKDLAQCKAQWREKFTAFEIVSCEDYAKAAVTAAEGNVRKRCGATPAGRWGIDRDPHLFWCLPRIGNPAGKAEVDRESKIRETGVKACEGGVDLSDQGFPPIKKLGKHKGGGGNGSRLRPDQIKVDQERIDGLVTPRPKPAKIIIDPASVRKPAGGGGILPSTCSNAMDRLGGGCGTVPNLVPADTGKGGPTLAGPSAGGGRKPGSGAGGGAGTPTVAAPSGSAAPRSKGIDPGIDYGGAAPRTGTKIR
jgi:hypothetical protein